ncbi:MAG: valine--tRNA ligase [Patescibacteria group bacterium]|jgi:valyl-tRNA synthetase
MSKEFAKTWDSKKFEEDLYQNWEKSGYFKPELNMPENPKYDRALEGKPFVIPIPPPNVTGKLHIGHSLFITIQDVMIRFHRMLGEPTLWIPGTDHAGIATQTVVDKALQKKGIKRHEIGREKFVEEVWKWKEEYGGIITSQLKRMGASCDWSRERFTLDEGLSKAVKEAFVHLYEKGLIYRGEYIVNWCPKCGTAIADDEMEHEEQTAKLYYFKYDKNFPITIATTRPETKLGDTAVAVNPTDKRYEQYIGKEFDVDIDGVKRKIKIVADRSIDMKFGTGAVGITPAHSAIDWKIGEVNDLPIVKVIDERAKMTAEAGKYEGMKVLEAREKLVEYLKGETLLEKEEPITNNLSVCYRCNTAIEPIPSLQWFVSMRPLAEKAKAAVTSGAIKIIPKRFEKNYNQWMDNIRDWCISRQLWWGHRIPVWYRKQENLKPQTSNLKPEDIYVGKEPPADIESWIQDEDVLDTWFSSALWPFSSLGWPEKTKDLQYFYPATVLETGYDILFFWVARMVMMGLELTDSIPFENIYLHGLVRDEKNRKMSKSLGNALDPLDMIDKYGTDAVRMGLVVGTTPGLDIPVGEHKLKNYRNFSNKIWNASRFVSLRVSEGDLASGEIGDEKIENLNIDQSILTDADKKILEAHEEIKKRVTKDLKEFKFSGAGEGLYEYFWHNFCDIYIEAAKGQLQTEEPKNRRTEEHSENTKKILLKVLSESLQMLHPFVPYVTEAVWQELREIYPKLSESIMISKWPM